MTKINNWMKTREGAYINYYNTKREGLNSQDSRGDHTIKVEVA